MFHLELSISDWRKQMVAAGIQSPVTLDELESHLREEIAQQMESGLAEQKAFETATAKIGPGAVLSLEFKKSGVDAELRTKRVGRWFSGLTVAYALVLTILLIRHQPEFSFNERFLGFGAVAAMLASVFVAWRILPGFFPFISSKRVQFGIGLLGGIAGVGWFFVFVFLILPRCRFTEGQLVVAIFWALVPVQALPTAAFMILDKNERRRVTSGNSHVSVSAEKK